MTTEETTTEETTTEETTTAEPTADEAIADMTDPAELPPEEPVAAAPPAEEKPVTKRRRSKVSKEKGNYRTEVPLDEIQDLSGSTSRVILKVWRRNSRGQLAKLKEFDVSVLEELADVENWLFERFGGGRFRCECYALENRTERVITPFEILLDGNPKPFNDGSAAVPPQQVGAPSMPLQVPNPRNVPAWLRAEPAEVQHAYMAQQAPMGAPATTVASDQVAMQELNFSRDELAKERTAREEDRKAADARHQDMMKRLDDEREGRRQKEIEASNDRSREVTESLRAEVRAMREKPAEKTGLDAVAIAALVTAGAPVLTALISSGKDREQIAVDRQANMMKAQSDSTDALIKAAFTKQDNTKPLMEMGKVMVPLLAPLVKEWFAAKSPKAMADLVATQADAQLSSIGMMVNLMNDLNSGQPEPPWWAPMVAGVLETMQTAAQATADQTKEFAGVPTGPKSPEQTQAQPGQPSQPGQPGQQEWTPGHEIARQVMHSSSFPDSFKSEEWAMVLVAVHNGADPKQIAIYMADLVRKLHNDGKLPQELANIWEEPDTTLQALFAILPIWQTNQPYAVEVINATIDVLSVDGDDTPGTEPSPPETAEGVVEAPPEGAVQAAMQGKGSPPPSAAPSAPQAAPKPVETIPFTIPDPAEKREPVPVG